MGMKRKFGTDKTWTGNDHDVLKLLFTDTYSDNMSKELMNALAEDYSGSTRFKDRMRKFTVRRWVQSNNVPFEDMLTDWMELGLITEKIVKDSLIIKNYEDSIAVDEFIAARKIELAEREEFYKKAKV
tara:strand:+ start:560 stop:943 length:384 start_codon:yes stop_codon:yes gene_type:complete